MPQRPRRLETSKATCAAPLCEVPSLCRGRRPHHAGKEHAGTWETSCRLRSLWRSRVGVGSAAERSHFGRQEESDGCVVPMKPRTRPTASAAEGVEGRRPVVGKAAATQAPDPEPDKACHRSGEPAGRGCKGHPGPEPRSRLTRDKSPVRQSRTPGSVGEVPGNWHLYPTTIDRLVKLIEHEMEMRIVARHTMVKIGALLNLLPQYKND